MRRRSLPIQSLASLAPRRRVEHAFCAPATRALDNRGRERLLMMVRVLRPGIRSGCGRRAVAVGSPAVAGKHKRNVVDRHTCRTA